MNKHIAITIVSVIVLGMGLIMYNEYAAGPSLNQQSDTAENTNTLQETPHAKVSANTSAMPSPIAPDNAPLKPGQETLASELSQEAPEPLAAPFDPASVILPSPIAPPAAPVQMAASEPEAPEEQTEHTEEAPIAEEAPVEEVAQIPSPIAQDSPEEEQTTNNTEQAENTIKEELEEATKESTTEKVTETPKPTESASSEKRIEELTMFSRGKWFTVRLMGNVMPRYTYLRLSNPERLVLDFIGHWDIPVKAVTKNPFVSNMRVGEHKNGTRLVFDLAKVPAKIVYWKYESTGLDIRMQ